LREQARRILDGFFRKYAQLISTSTPAGREGTLLFSQIVAKNIQSKGVKMMLDSEQIQQIIPHRNPFLLVDRILEIEEGKRAVGLKNVTVNEPFFAGHFPGYPVMPGVLIVEALAQVGATAILKVEANRNKLAFFAGIDNFRFREQVKPGDTLRLEVEITRLKGPVGKGKAVASVDGRVVAEGEIMFALAEGSKQ
jgi:3-hydroxyacyl-[acyl-carrier-protein] dehydratase